MPKNTILILFLSAFAMTASGALAQPIEVVHSINFDSTSHAKASLEALFEDPAMAGGKATLYALDVGDGPSSHIVVVDFDSYADRVRLNAKRFASHGWSKYMLAIKDQREYLGANLVSVVDDHGKSRHTAGYLAAYLIHTTDAALYREGIKDLNDAVGNPGVLRLVALRSGNRNVTHAVLIGGKDFVAVNEYLDKLTSSDAYEAFTEKVGDTRKVVAIEMFRRIGAWGY